MLLRLVDKLPDPSVRVQRIIAAAVILSQGGIAVTGAIVRVTASGLGCPTWPQCFPGSFTPVAVSEVPRIHQAVEFGNRMITFAVVLTAALAVLAVTRARRRREVLVYAWLMPASTVVQAIIGGITVRTGLLWWTVAIHLLASMTMVWLSVLLYVKIGEPDDGGPRATSGQAAPFTDGSERAESGGGAGDGDAGDCRRPARGRQEPKPNRAATQGRNHHAGAHAFVATGVLFGAAGRAGVRVVGGARKQSDHAAAHGAARPGFRTEPPWARRSTSPGCPQFWSPFTLAGAAACTAATAALWASMRERSRLETAPDAG